MMQNQQYQKAFYCGHFTMKYTPALKKVLRNLGWLPELFTSDMQKQEPHYYKNFIDFNFHSRIGEGIWATRLPINKFFTINDNSIYLNEIKLYVLPYRIVLFSVETTMRGTLGSFCRISKKLRDISHYKKAPQPWLNLAIKPLIEVYKVLTGSEKASYTNLVENGSKMKVYQILGGDFHDIENERKCRLLYKMGTFSTNSNEKGEGMQVSDDYVFDVINTNTLSIYKDWWALSLLDTHTVISFDGINRDFVNKHVLFFRIIYLYELFSKCFLFDLHRRHHLAHKKSDTSNLSLRYFLGIQSKPIDYLTSELNAFEAEYAFYNISYDYLPLELHEFISKGLQVDDERKAILDLITREKENEDAQNSKKLNVIIRVLSLFTFFLSIPAACDLANKIVPFAVWMPNESLGYLLFSFFFVFISVLGVILLVKYIDQNNPSKKQKELKRKEGYIKVTNTKQRYPKTNQVDVNNDLIDHNSWNIFERFYLPGSVHEGRAIQSFPEYVIVLLQPYDAKAILFKRENEESEIIRTNQDYKFYVKRIDLEDQYIEVLLETQYNKENDETLQKLRERLGVRMVEKEDGEEGGGEAVVDGVAGERGEVGQQQGGDTNRH